MKRWKSLLISLGGQLLPRKILQLLTGKVDFAFIIHPRDVKDIGRKFPFVARLPERLVLWVFDHLWPIPVSPIHFSPPNLESFRGWQIAVPSTATLLLRDRYRARKKILAAVRLAEKMGARLVGLGAFTASLTEGGRYITSRRISCRVTTGHSLTVAMVIATAKKAAEVQEIAFQEATIAVVGACGSIGSACSRWLARENVNILILNDLDQSALRELKMDLSGESTSHIETCTDLRSISEADIVIVATNHPGLLIRPQHLKPRCVVIDDAQPPNVSPAALNGKKALLAWGGLVQAPGINIHFDVGLVGRHTVFSCLGECLVLVAYGINENYSVGPVDLKKAQHLSSLASDLGFSLPPLQAFGKLVDVKEADRTASA